MMTAQTLDALYQECQSSFTSLWGTQCPTLVFGDGMGDSPTLMLIGEAPGAQEAKQGKPFVGKAGKNLDAFLQSVNLQRDALYISNVVKFRPSKISAAGREVNRPPTRTEIDLFTPWLYREIALVKPHWLVTLGNVALNAVLGSPAGIGEMHGHPQTVRIPSDNGEFVVSLFPLYHPASIIYNRALSPIYQADLFALSKLLIAEYNVSNRKWLL